MADDGSFMKVDGPFYSTDGRNYLFRGHTADGREVTMEEPIPNNPYGDKSFNPSIHHLYYAANPQKES